MSEALTIDSELDSLVGELEEDTPPELHLHDLYNLPGAMSASRLPLGLFTAWAIRNEHYVVATASGALAAASDLEGRVARARGQASAAGALADIFFDRLFDLCVVPAFKEKGIISPTAANIKMASDSATLIGGGVILYKNGGDVRELMPTKVGKAGAVFNFLGAVSLIASHAAPENYKKPLKTAGNSLIATGFGLGALGRGLLVREKHHKQQQLELAMISERSTNLAVAGSLTTE